MPNTREKLAELLYKCEQVHERDLNDDWADGEIEAIADHLIAHGVTVQKWIPVTERLPEPGAEVLVYTKYPHSSKMEIGVFTYAPEMYQPHWQYVTHWMPLPEPPEIIIK